MQEDEEGMFGVGWGQLDPLRRKRGSKISQEINNLLGYKYFRLYRLRFLTVQKGWNGTWNACDYFPGTREWGAELQHKSGLCNENLAANYWKFIVFFNFLGGVWKLGMLSRLRLVFD